VSAVGTQVPADLQAIGEIGQDADLPEQQEGFTQVCRALARLPFQVRHEKQGRHLGHQVIRCHGLDGGELAMSVPDNGQGGANLFRSRGLRGLTDRVAIAGPTCVLADVPLPSRSGYDGRG
jgi:hypothetical protein